MLFLFLKLLKLQSGKKTLALFGVIVNYTTPLYNRKYAKTLIHITVTAHYPNVTAEVELRANGFCDKASLSYPQLSYVLTQNMS